MLRETLLPSHLYNGITEEQALELPFRKILGDMRYLDQKAKMELAEHERRMSEQKAEQSRLRNKGG